MQSGSFEINSQSILALNWPASLMPIFRGMNVDTQPSPGTPYSEVVMGIKTVQDLEYIQQQYLGHVHEWLTPEGALIIAYPKARATGYKNAPKRKDILAVLLEWFDKKDFVSLLDEWTGIRCQMKDYQPRKKAAAASKATAPAKKVRTQPPKPVESTEIPELPTPTESACTPEAPQPTESACTPEAPQPTESACTPEAPQPTESACTPEAPQPAENLASSEPPKPAAPLDNSHSIEAPKAPDVPTACYAAPDSLTLEIEYQQEKRWLTLPKTAAFSALHKGICQAYQLPPQISYAFYLAGHALPIDAPAHTFLDTGIHRNAELVTLEALTAPATYYAGTIRGKGADAFAITRVQC